MTVPPALRELPEPSQLGSKAYWDEYYAREVSNNLEDHTAEGTIWFEESNAETAILRLLDRLAQDQLIFRENSQSNDKLIYTCATTSAENAKAARFLDLGTGNGHLLFTLRQPDEDGLIWKGALVGVDYSQGSISLAQHLAAIKQVQNVRFDLWNILDQQPGDWLQDGFEVVLDKGTFDAISLMAPSCDSTSHPCDQYRARVVSLIKPGHFLCITSCNWTKHELLEWFVTGTTDFRFLFEARYPTFSFGGVPGQTVVTVMLQRISQ